MDPLEGIWRLVESRAWDEQGNALAPPYGSHPMGQIAFANGRMLAVLCNGGAEVVGKREYSSYGGTYTFDGATLATLVDVASDPKRIGGTQTRRVVISGDTMVLHPPMRAYGGALERRELVWQRVWHPR
jgi:hypothetical protein